MATNAKEFYAQTVRNLSPKERLRLAAMILNDLTSSCDVDSSDSWSDQDLQDLTASRFLTARILMNQRRKRIPQSGEVVLLDFPGVKQTKRRPAVIVSSSLYYQQRTDVVVGLIASQIISVSLRWK